MKYLFVSMPVKQNLFVSVFVHKCLMMLNNVEYIQNVCYANEQLSLCYFFSINVCYHLARPLGEIGNL